MSKKHRKEHHEEHIDETWLIPYADLLTLLLALFIILFASSQIDSKKYDQIMRALNSAFSGGTGMFEVTSAVPVMQEPVSESKKKDKDEDSPQNSTVTQQQQQLEKEKKDLEELKQKLDGYIKENGLDSQLETKLTPDMLMITIRDHALFTSGSAAVKPEAQKLAGAISDMLAGYPNYNIEVAGHTDNVPINRGGEFETNWDLSARRSLNFMKYLLASGKAGPERFRSIGYGEYRPIETNDTPEGRSKNRRVEVNILRNLKEIEVNPKP
jgi:chemotaxis protein MotB